MDFMDFIYLLINKLGYYTVIHMKDAILFLAGIFIGMVIMSLLAGNIIYKLQKSEHLDKVNLVKLIHEGKKHYLANPQSFGESVETLLILIFKPMFTIKSYTLRDEKRTKTFLIIVLFIGIFLVVLGMLFINTTILPADIPKK